MKHLFQGGRRKVAAVMAIALVASLSQVAPSNAAKQKNKLTVLISEKDAGWCSQDSPGLDQIAIKNAVAETLTIRNASGRIVPYLAKSITPSNSFKTWDITLREGIFFHDGEELTAATVVANYAAGLGLNTFRCRARAALRVRAHREVQCGQTRRSARTCSVWWNSSRSTRI